MDSYANGYDLVNTYGSTADSVAVGGIIGALFAIIGIIILISLVIAIFQIVGLWKVFKKANQPGWAAIIPIYNTYTLCKIVGVNPWWIVVVLCSSLFGIIPVIGSLLTIAVTIYFGVLLAVSTARSFGKEDAYAVGLYFLQPFFMFALGVGKSEYVGAKPMNDVVFEKLGINKNTNEQATNSAPTATQDVTFCSSCGTKLDSDSKFCPNCGKEK